MKGNYEPVVMYDPDKKQLILTNDADDYFRTVFEHREEIDAFIESFREIRDRHFTSNEEKMMLKIREQFLHKKVRLGGSNKSLVGIVQDIRISNGQIIIRLGDTYESALIFSNVLPGDIHIVEVETEHD